MSWTQSYGGTVGNDFTFLAPIATNSTRCAIVFPQISEFSSYYLGYLGLAEELPFTDSGGNEEVITEEFSIWYNRQAWDINPARQYTAYLFIPDRVLLVPTYCQIWSFVPDSPSP